ncbi:MAG: LamG domain-containing protein [Armatimonadota bacterium]|nr:LamG domain-containing protein [Armatimonadota bacterium]
MSRSVVMAAAIAGCVACAGAQIDPAALEARGVTFYAPFEGEVAAHYARGDPEPISLVNVQFVEGRIGRAALTQRSKEAELGKVKGRATSLNYDATGNLYGERGTVAYWLQPLYDADDPTIRSGSNSTGPYLLNVSAVEDTYYRQFIRANIKGGAFYFWVVDRDGGQHGLSYGEGIRTWKAGEWHHIVMTWDAGQGMRFYDNGKMKYSTWGEDAYPPATPFRIGVGCGGPTARPQYTTSADAVYDELIMLDRAVTDDEVVALMEGRYLDLHQAMPVEYTAEQLADRRRRLLIEEDPDRLTVRAEGGVARVRFERIQPVGIDVRFIESALLADGRWQPAASFAQGGLTMDRDITFRLPEGSEANYLVVVGRPPEGASFRVEGLERDLRTTAAGAGRARLPATGDVLL